MTAIDTGELRQRLAAYAALDEYERPGGKRLMEVHFAQVDVPALCAALLTERERTRVLTAALERLCFGADHEMGVDDAPDWYASQAWSSAIACVALAAVGEEEEGTR